MIPIRLELEAFGPFATKQKIDFTQFDADRLFLISGQTGSGKTTIFDAITFSLFGQASGFTRQADSFKSHFASDSVVSFTEFTFFVKGQTYTVHREPIQLKLKRNQNVVKESSTATLTFEDNSIISGTATVDRYIEELLGMNADQFKKIVLLPQGEFRKFLSDDSNEKQKILRKIFNTKILDDFTEQLRIDCNDSRLKLEHTATEYHTHLSNIAYIEIDETLSGNQLLSVIESSKEDMVYTLSLINEYNSACKKQMQQQEASLELLREKKQALNLPYFEEINHKFELLANAKKSQAELLSKASFYADVESKIKLYKSVKELAPSYNILSSTRAQIKAIEQKLIDVSTSLERSKSLLEAALATHSKAASEQENVLLMIKRVEEISYLQKTFDEIRKLKTAIKNNSQQLENAAKNLNAITNYLEYSIQNEARNALLEQVKKLDTATQFAAKYKDCKAFFISQKECYQANFNAFINGQALMLAATLISDSPCPVCGSLSHPNPACKNETKTQITQEQLNHSKLLYEQSSQQLEAVLSQYKLSLKNAELAEIPLSTDEDFARINAAKTLVIAECMAVEHTLNAINLREDLAKLSPIPEHEKVEKKQAFIEKEIAVLQQNADNQNKQLQELLIRCDDTVDESLLDAESSRLQAEIKSVQKALNDSQAALSSASTSAAKYTEAQSQLTTQLTTLKLDQTQQQFTLTTSLEKLNLDEEKLLSLLPLATLVGSLEKEYSDYKNSLLTFETQINILTEQLLDSAPVDLSKLKLEDAQITAKIAANNQLFLSIASAFSSNHDLYEKLKSTQKQYQKYSDRFKKINKLFEVASGKYSDRVNFERYILAAYFDDVIENANVRLKQMTASRYSLQRRQEKEKGNKSSGLALDIFDTYTGKPRHVNTLSGGESFKISLSLALGLADIISQSSGGIELSTLFIDEGFGSLDSNSLESAIECLDNLRESGRYIGIISHVSELKEKISSQIVVVQEPVGSHIVQ